MGQFLWKEKSSVHFALKSISINPKSESNKLESSIYKWYVFGLGIEWYHYIWKKLNYISNVFSIVRLDLTLIETRRNTGDNEMILMFNFNYIETYVSI